MAVGSAPSLGRVETFLHPLLGLAAGAPYLRSPRAARSHWLVSLAFLSMS